MARRARLIGLALDHSLLFHQLEPGGDKLRANPCIHRDRLEPPPSKEQLAQDQQHPSVAEQAGRHLKKVVLELGGSDPFILLSTNDLDATVEMATNARLDNSGQSCNGAKRFIVIDSLYDAFLEKFVAAMSGTQASDPMVEGGAYGPLSSSSAAAVTA